MLQRWLTIIRNCSCEMGWKQDAFLWNNKHICIDSFKLLKLSVVVIESKNEATAAFRKMKQQRHFKILCYVLYYSAEGFLNCD